MKKVIIMLAAALCTLAAMATEFTGKLTVSINGVGGSQATAIQINEVDGKYNLDLNNFVLEADGETMGVGNINLHGLTATTAHGFNTIQFDGKIEIPAGDLEGVELWMGPFLGEVPIIMTADFNDKAMNVNIDIDMTATLEQIIKVNFVGCAPVQAGLKGDVNGDGNIDVNDINTVIDAILNN